MPDDCPQAGAHIPNSFLRLRILPIGQVPLLSSAGTRSVGQMKKNSVTKKENYLIKKHTPFLSNLLIACSQLTSAPLAIFALRWCPVKI